jgi:hypothetical protein
MTSGVLHVCSCLGEEKQHGRLVHEFNGGTPKKALKKTYFEN